MSHLGLFMRQTVRMTTDNSQSGGIVAGWYADPSSSERMRYWDGGAWTERTAPLAAPQQAQPEPVQQAEPVQ